MTLLNENSVLPAAFAEADARKALSDPGSASFSWKCIQCAHQWGSSPDLAYASAKWCPECSRKNPLDEMPDFPAHKLADPCGALDAPEAQLRKARARIAELEVQVLSSDTVSKAEYAAMVKQRDTMREELKAARHMLDDALGWLKLYGAAPSEALEWPELSQLIRTIEALPPFRA